MVKFSIYLNRHVFVMDVNFNESLTNDIDSLTNDIVSFEQLGPGFKISLFVYSPEKMLFVCLTTFYGL